ncbi:MAG: AMP-dependent synthetase/ligase [Gemmatimonadota bacterium]
MTTLSGGPAVPSSTLTALFFESVEQHDRPDAYQGKRNGVWQPVAHSEVLERARHLALGLETLGVGRGDRVGLMSENRPEWALVDWACLCSGVVDVPIYPTLPAEQIIHPLNDAGVEVLFVSTPEQAAKAGSVRANLKTLRSIVSFTYPVPPGADHSLAELEAAGARLDSRERAATWKARALAIAPDELATLIYTSGTTGLPKGVMLSHGNIASNCAALRRQLDLRAGDVALSFLPLSHILERTGDYVLFAAGVSIAYAESTESISANMEELRPQLALCVPRLFEKMYARIVEGALVAGGLRAHLFRWARGVGERAVMTRLRGGTPSGLLGIQSRLADRLVFAPIRSRLGGQLRFLVSGGAPVAPAINTFFHAAGLPILEGYGLTETSPVITMNTLDALRIGAVGTPIPGVEVAIADDGEILTRGPHVMQGYYQRPENTAEVIDAEGWLHTGDIGVVEGGFLRITDRKKDIIVTAGGKNIAPQPIENLLKLNLFISQAVMLGDGRRYPIVLVVPDWTQLEAWATQQRLAWGARSELLATPVVAEKIAQEVQQALAGLASFEMPKRIGLLEHELSVERGELTPKMSVRRRVISQAYGELIEALYAED